MFELFQHNFFLLPDEAGTKFAKSAEESVPGVFRTKAALTYIRQQSVTQLLEKSRQLINQNQHL